MTDLEDLSGSPLATYWEDLLGDMDATADEYDDGGWETLRLHPGDVTPLDGEYGDRVGLDVLIPDNEYERLAGLFDADFALEDYEVYRTSAMGTVFLLVVVRDADRRAVLVPAYYRTDDAAARRLFERALEEGALDVSLRRLSGERVEVRLDEPDLLAPPTDDDAGDD